MIQRKTPTDLIQRMIGLVDNLGWRILEPSAGDGDICDALMKVDSNLNITAIELSSDKYKTLQDKGYFAIHTDFLKWNDKRKYDTIIAAPPFKANIDCEHIMKMYTHLDKGGCMVTLTSPYWLTNNEPNHQVFRNWLDGVDHSLYKVKEGTFSEKKGNIPTMILKVNK